MWSNRFRSQLMNCANPLRRWFDDSRGNVSLIFGLSAIPLLAIGTMAVDFSNGMRLKSEIQAAADAGVLAAATALASGQDDQSKEQIANDAFFANLSQKSKDALVSTPVPDVDFDNRIITMTVAVETNQLVTKLLTEKIGINVLAKAKVENGNPICMMSFNPTAKEALYINGTADVMADGCSVHVNSNHEEALRQVGSGQAEAESFCVRGDFEGSNYTPMPQKNCLEEKDPLKDYFDTAWTTANPGAIACTDIDDLNLWDGTDIAFLPPGVYCDDLTVSSGDTLILTGSPNSTDPLDAMKDLYVFVDGNLSVQGGGTVRNFWNPGTDGNPGGGGYSNPSTQILLFGPSNPGGTLDVQGGGDVWLNAKSEGTFAGIAIAQHPDAVLKNNDEHLITGGGDININGIVYFPTQPLLIAGNGVIGDNASQFAIMADTITVKGTGTLEIRIGADYQAAGLPELPEAQERIVLIE